jgi:hypothetical protein
MSVKQGLTDVPSSNVRERITLHHFYEGSMQKPPKRWTQSPGKATGNHFGLSGYKASNFVIESRVSKVVEGTSVYVLSCIELSLGL